MAITFPFQQRGQSLLFQNAVLLEDSDDLRVTFIEELIESSPPLGLLQANSPCGNFARATYVLDLLVFLGFLDDGLFCITRSFPLFGTTPGLNLLAMMRLSNLAEIDVPNAAAEIQDSAKQVSWQHAAMTILRHIMCTQIRFGSCAETRLSSSDAFLTTLQFPRRLRCAQCPESFIEWLRLQERTLLIYVHMCHSAQSEGLSSPSPCWKQPWSSSTSISRPLRSMSG